MLPLETPKKRRGRPQASKSAPPLASSQRGCEMIPTRKPRDASSRPISGTPKVGWSTYASPFTRTTSSASHPRARASSSVVGGNAPGSGRFLPIWTRPAIRHGLTRAAMCVNPAGGRTPRGFCYARIPPGARPPMSDLQAEPRPPQPFPAEEASSAAPADPLAGDWSEGLPGPVRAHGLPLPARVGTGPRALPAAEPADAAEMEVSIEAPDAWTVGDPVAGGTGQALQPAETPWSGPVQDTGTAAPWMAPPSDPEVEPIAKPPAEAWSQGTQPEAWQDPEPSPWMAAPEPTPEWTGTAQAAATADQWASAPAEEAASWESPETARAPGLMPVSSAMPDESTWSAPPPGEGAELMPEPAAPAWASEQRQVF